MKNDQLRIATRKSPLALWQANHVANALKNHWPQLEVILIPMQTSGDRFLKEKLLTLGGKGLFVKELEEALLDGRADIAVHSMKDVPVSFPDGLGLPVISERHSPFDAFVSLHYTRLDLLPQGAIIGTSSLRRQSQLLAIRPDLIIHPLRGNIHTRLEKLKGGAFDAIILATAGLQRMGLQDFVTQQLPLDIMLPACGQGALGIECRSNDEQTQRLIAPLNDPIASTCVQSERHVNARLGGHCHAPLSVYCQVTEPHEDHKSAPCKVYGKVSTPNGELTLTDTQEGPFELALLLAEQCAQSLLTQGAQSILNAS